MLRVEPKLAAHINEPALKGGVGSIVEFFRIWEVGGLADSGLDVPFNSLSSKGRLIELRCMFYGSRGSRFVKSQTAQ
jgi:hypothetical protein